MTAPQMPQGYVVKVAGPLVVAEGLAGAKMYDLVRVGDAGPHRRDHRDARRPRLDPGLRGDRGPRPRRPGRGHRRAALRRARPGHARESVYDGVQRPLDAPRGAVRRSFLTRGVERARPRPREALGVRRRPSRPGDAGRAGRHHRHGAGERRSSSTGSWCPPACRARSPTSRPAARTRSTDADRPSSKTDARRERRAHADAAWPVRAAAARTSARSRPDEPLVTGTARHRHVLPARQGRHRLRPGPVRQRQDRRRSTSSPSGPNADIVVYIGCGERGNEMTDVLMEFPELDRPALAASRS